MYVFLEFSVLLNKESSRQICSLKGPESCLRFGNADSGVLTSFRVKTGYVTNKVIGVDGGMFPQ